MSQDTRDQVLRNVPLLDKLPKRAWTRETGLLRCYLGFIGEHAKGTITHLIIFAGSIEIRLTPGR